MRELKRRTLTEATKGLYIELEKGLYERLRQYCFDNNMSKAFFLSELLEKVLSKGKLLNDNVSAFIDEMLEYPADNPVPKSWLYKKYVDYCKEIETHPVVKAQFETRLQAHDIQEKRTSVKLCRAHRNFRCNVRNKNGLACKPSDYEWVTQRCFYGIDLKDETLTP